MQVKQMGSHLRESWRTLYHPMDDVHTPGAEISIPPGTTLEQYYERGFTKDSPPARAVEEAQEIADAKMLKVHKQQQAEARAKHREKALAEAMAKIEAEEEMAALKEEAKAKVKAEREMAKAQVAAKGKK